MISSSTVISFTDIVFGVANVIPGVSGGTMMDGFRRV